MVQALAPRLHVSPQDFAGLLLRAQAGDEQAFGVVYRAHVRYVAGIAYRLLRSKSDVEDVVQMVFVEALHAANKLRDPNSFRSWLYKLTVHQAHRKLTQRTRRERLDRALRWVLPHAYERSEQLSNINRELRRLDPDERVPWLLHRVEGESLPETARLCGVSLATVKRRIKRAETLLFAGGT